MQVADVIVIGLGAMGSAVAAQLTRRGHDVIGVDRFSPPHAEGSSHGETRITRQAIGEGESYVPFAMRSHEIWRELENETGEELLLTCGALVIGHFDSSAVHHGKPSFLPRTVAAARRYGIAHEVLGSDEAMRRFPQFQLRGDETAYLEPGGGLIYPERCIAAQLDVARRGGARLATGETVMSLQPVRGGVEVTTDRDRYSAAHAVVAAGAWTAALLGERFGHLEIHRQTLFWFEPDRPDLFRPDRCPVYIWMHEATPSGYFYGFPTTPVGAGVKLATEVYSRPATRPELVDRTVREGASRAFHDEHVEGRLVGLTARCIRASTCLYTAAPDGDFIIDRHPEWDAVTVVSACSGHGFKHSAAIGEAVAERVATGRSRLDLSPFPLTRPVAHA